MEGYIEVEPVGLKQFKSLDHLSHSRTHHFPSDSPSFLEDSGVYGVRSLATANYVIPLRWGHKAITSLGLWVVRSEQILLDAVSVLIGSAVDEIAGRVRALATYGGVTGSSARTRTAGSTGSASARAGCTVLRSHDDRRAGARGRTRRCREGNRHRNGVGSCANVGVAVLLTVDRVDVAIAPVDLCSRVGRVGRGNFPARVERQRVRRRDVRNEVLAPSSGSRLAIRRRGRALLALVTDEGPARVVADVRGNDRRLLGAAGLVRLNDLLDELLHRSVLGHLRDPLLPDSLLRQVDTNLPVTAALDCSLDVSTVLVLTRAPIAENVAGLPGSPEPHAVGVGVGELLSALDPSSHGRNRAALLILLRETLLSHVENGNTLGALRLLLDEALDLLGGVLRPVLLDDGGGFHLRRRLELAVVLDAGAERAVRRGVTRETGEARDEDEEDRNHREGDRGLLVVGVASQDHNLSPPR